MWKSKESSILIRRFELLLTVGINLGILFYYKYFDFAVSNLNGIFGTNIALRHIALPIGISFFTFQGMSYVLDVYMGKTEVQKNPLNVALYIALFPQLIAGPIVRYTDINEEIDCRKETLDDFAQGVQRFSVGLAKKVVLSNSFAVLADQAFGMSPAELGVGMAWLGALGYTMQIYFDFSGYSDMAIGIGRMFGFHFLENFNYPYTSTNATVFWRRWHISLSSWFRDYVYIPLGGNRRGNVYLHLLTVFFLTGLWHGASWNFVVWGLWHGMFLIIERVLRNKKVTIPVPKALKWCYTMLIVVIGWVFFRASDLTAALAYLKCMVPVLNRAGNALMTRFYYREYVLLFIAAAVASTPVVKRLSEENWLKKEKNLLAPIACIILLAISVATLSVTTYNPFIYFNF